MSPIKPNRALVSILIVLAIAVVTFGMVTLSGIRQGGSPPPTDNQMRLSWQSSMGKIETLNESMLRLWKDVTEEAIFVTADSEVPSAIYGFSYDPAIDIDQWEIDLPGQERHRVWRLMKRAGVTGVEINKDGAWYRTWPVDGWMGQSRGYYYYDSSEWDERFGGNSIEAASKVRQLQLHKTLSDESVSFVRLTDKWFEFRLVDESFND